MSLTGTCRVDPDPAVALSTTYVIAEFRNFGALINPANLSVHVLTPDGTVTTYSSPVNGIDGVQDTTQVGRWYLSLTPPEGEISVTWYTGTVPIRGAQARFASKRALSS